MEEKYPKYFMGVIFLYIITLAAALTILPAAFYVIQDIFFIAVILLPLPFLLMYFLGKPDIEPKYLRYSLLGLFAFSLFFLYILIYVFF